MPDFAPPPARSRVATPLATVVRSGLLPTLAAVLVLTGIDRWRGRAIAWDENLLLALALGISTGYPAWRSAREQAAAARGDYGPEVYGGRAARWLDGWWAGILMAMLAFALGTIIVAWVAERLG